MTAPRISVLITCFNLGEYLDEAVDSVLAQTRDDVEILIVDDGSTDAATRSKITHYDRPKTTAFATGNQGLARARNFLIARARGEYLSALDADDRLHPSFFERTTAVLDVDPDVAFVSTHLQMFGTENREWPETASADLPTLLAEDTVITPAVVRASAVAAVGGYDEHMPSPGDEDWDLWLTLVEAGYRGVILPDVLFYYRRRAGSMCEQCTSGQTHLDLVEYLMRKHAPSYEQHVLSVLLHKERAISALRREALMLEGALATELEPAVARCRKEMDVLRQRLRGLRDRREDMESLRAEYARSQQEVAALRTSLSWRLTAPLRSLHDAVQRMRARPPS